MIHPANHKIIVSVDMRQKDTMKIGDIEVKTGLIFETNYREKSPVIAKVEQGNEVVRTGSIIITHHNHFYPPSPYHLYDNLYSIPTNHTIFAILRDDGELQAVYGNILGNRVDIDTFLPVPEDQRKKHHDRLIVTDGGSTRYQRGQLVFTRPHAPYDIVYNFGGEVKRVTKLNSEMVVGVAK
jgi:hypothetical protein